MTNAPGSHDFINRVVVTAAIGVDQHVISLQEHFQAFTLGVLPDDFLCRGCEQQEGDEVVAGAADR
jgi:hypothetical protein